MCRSALPTVDVPIHPSVIKSNAVRVGGVEIETARDVSVPATQEEAKQNRCFSLNTQVIDGLPPLQHSSNTSLYHAPSYKQKRHSLMQNETQHVLGAVEGVVHQNNLRG